MGFHQKSAHSNRISKLAHSLGETINTEFPDETNSIRALDVGCGDLSLAESIKAAHPRIEWVYTDIHELPADLRDSRRWSNYKQFDGKSLPFDEGSFDVVLFSDVLHHCMDNAATLLSEALRVGKRVVVKDHLEYGQISRQMLRLMDFIGNYGYGVEIPKSYFTKESFRETYVSAGASLSGLNVGLDLYSGFPVIRNVIQKKWQFVAVLQKSGSLS